MRLAAPAKVNLGLRIVGTRPDGYHCIESVFVPLDLADQLELELEPSSTPRVELELLGEADGVPGGEENLAQRAAAAFLEAARLPRRVRIRLTKRIPAAAGLGGGSSDAGAILRALDALLPGALPGPALRALALGLGADVPYFLLSRPALVSGIGEALTPLAPFPSLSLLLLHPGLPLATADVYRAYDRAAASLTPPEAGSTLRRLTAFRAAQGPGRAAALAALLENDLEAAATALCAPIAALREALLGAGACAVGLSGSGPTVYGVFDDGEAARRARQALGGARRSWVATTLGAAGPADGSRAGASPNW